MSKIHCQFSYRLMSLLCWLVFSLMSASISCAAPAGNGPAVVRVVPKGEGFQLLRNGEPYYIKGAGGDGSKQLLHDAGANSVRTWGADNLGPLLDEAQKLGLTVTVGIWLGHKEHGFNYDNADQVAQQYESARQAILKYKDHPALLMWGIGNEMESGQEDNAAMWSAINNIAVMAKKLDPNHPTMTVIAEIGGNKVKNINRLCPDIDIIGINSYAGAPSIPQRYKAAGGVKPYVLTEFGPPGTWEVGKNSWGAVHEPTSAEKAEAYRKAYQQGVLASPLSLGSYAFTWGNKQEATATWFGMLLSDGSRVAAVDTMTELWSGKPPANRVPDLRSLKIQGADQVEPGGTVQANLDVVDPENDPLKVQWVLQQEVKSYNTGGANEAAPPTYPDAIVKADNKHAEIKMPKFGGGYRLFAFVHDNHGGAAVANVPLLVKGGDNAPLATAKAAQLPVVLYAEAGQAEPYAPSGYMGNTGAIKMDENATNNPHAGKTSLRVDYTAKDNWGGVVWQSPANDWGDAPGGLNLTGAKKLTFWARGEKGGEKVSFLFGLLAHDKAYFDTAQGKLGDVQLTTDWKQYSIDLTGKDLSRIKTGFAWTVAANGEPVTFYLDDIRYE
ncbi:MAG: hypothetical protein JO316_13610 [Abitibacteriaceae bacterium]|nr:hypothetical protein [Abditibacteriaceae bacterium]